ncbi:MAG TPA: class II aldolase [Clostridiaceae bacterium]|nr:class II aldolase [Clostridiaceae bacterium]
MNKNELKNLVKISQAVGNSPDIVQGGGGNTSVKLDGKLMAVKASGYRLNQIAENEGYVVVNYNDIKKYFDNVDLNSGMDYEKDSTEFLKKSVVKIEGLKELRPSVEAGFHSILKKYVIHTHAVYANILCCAAGGEEIAGKALSGSGITYIWIPYINPGFSLTLKIKEEIRKCIEKQGKLPEVILMANHGLIVNSDDCDECIRLHEKVNSMIKEYLKIDGGYPEIVLEEAGENAFVSRTKFISDFIKENKVDTDYFDRFPLYPDQLVYLNGNLPAESGEGKVLINTETGDVVYRTSRQEAMTIEETLLAYLYVIDNIQKKGWTIKTMTAEEVGFITNWESEKYRKSLAGK